MPTSTLETMRISRYILLSSILLVLAAAAPAQENSNATAKKKSREFWSLFSFKGIGLSTDLFGFASYALSDHCSGEVAAEANFGNRLYPAVEVGWGWCNTTDELSSIKYRASSPYYRVGFNYNFFTTKKEPNPKHYIYGLLRIGWSNFKYDVSTPPITDPMWGSSTALDLKDVDGSCLWGEIGAGIKVKIAKGFHMGWSVRYKVRFTEEVGPNSQMWYIPGFGINKTFCFGGTYSLIYDIPLR